LAWELAYFLGVAERKKILRSPAMLLDKNFAIKPMPEDIWLNSIDPNREDQISNSHHNPRQRRLRRMSGQNFIQRAVFSVIDLFKLDKEVA